MRLPIVATRSHLGKTLELDCDREIITLLGAEGEELGTLPWESVINQLLAQEPQVDPEETRSQPRVSLSFKVRYRTPEGHSFESHGGGIGGGTTPGSALTSRLPTSDFSLRSGMASRF